MLPALGSALPSAAPSAALAASSMPAGTGADAIALSRQQLQTAVAANGNASGFNPDQAASRQSRRVATPSIPSTLPTDDTPASTVPGTTIITLPAAPLPESFFGSRPLAVGTPLTSQLAAQFYAQEGNIPSLRQAANNNDAPDIDEDAAAFVRDVRAANGDLVSAATPRIQAYNAVLSTNAPRLATNTVVSWKTQLAPKRVGVADARGASAYAVAETRNRMPAASVNSKL